MRKMAARSTKDRRFTGWMVWHVAAKPQAVRFSNGRKRRQSRFRPSRKARLILSVIAALGLGLILLLALKKPPALPATTARSISDEVYQWVSQQQEIVSTGPLTALVEQTGDQLARNFQHKNIEWKFLVVRNSASPIYALPNGSIFLRNDTLLLINRIDDLTALLTHQMAHVTHGDISKRIVGEFDTEILQTLTPASEKWPQLLQVLNIVDDNYDFSRKQERLADEFALALMHKTCFQTHRLPVFWNKIRETENSHADFLNNIHPHSARSIRKMEQFIEGNELQTLTNCTQ